MNEVISVRIPTLPPSVNDYWGYTARGGRPRKYLTKKAKEFRSAVEVAFMNYALANGGSVPLFYDHDKKEYPRLGCIIVLSYKKISKSVKKVGGKLVEVVGGKWGWDIDNRVKPLLDALEHDRGRIDNTNGRFGLYWDDEQIDMALIVRNPTEFPRPGETNITIGPIELMYERMGVDVEYEDQD